MGSLLLCIMQHHPDVIKNRTSEAEIQDKSKGDRLSITLALTQTTWFILQCISRAIEGFAMTELEVATCAFAICSPELCDIRSLME